MSGLPCPRLSTTPVRVRLHEALREQTTDRAGIRPGALIDPEPHLVDAVLAYRAAGAVATLLAALAAEGRLLLPPLPHGCCVGCQKEGGGAKEEGPGQTAGSDAGTLLAAGGAVGAPLAPAREQTQGTLEVEPRHVHCLVLFV